MKKTIGILGGMGPLATADLFRKIIDNTQAGCDQDHLRVVIDSNTNIPDRTAAILSGEAERGIMFCGTGVGAAIACNKVRGIRASVCHDLYTAHQCVEHDDVQIIALGAQIVGPTVAEELIDLFLAARFSTSEEFRRRVAKLDDMDAAR